MWNWVSAGFFVLGAIHVPPSIGAVSPDALSALYGAATGESAVQVLLQHRGAMFAFVAVGCFYAALAPRWQPAVAILAGWSMITFLGIYLGAGAQSGPLLKVAIADGVGVAVLVPIAIVLLRRQAGLAAATR